MKELQRSEIDKFLLGFTLVLCLVFGGGTGTGLMTDTAIQLVAVVTSTIVCLRHMDRPIDRRVFWFAMAAGLAIVLQLLPISTAAIRSSQGILPQNVPLPGFEPSTISLGLGRTIEVAGYFLTLCLFLAAVLNCVLTRPMA